jgi:uncharacterized protein with FMN-binding domain
MTTPADNSNWSAPVPPGSIDPLVQARLDRLAQRNASPSASAATSRANSAHTPLGASARPGVPPVSGPATGSARSGFPAPASGTVAPTARTGRRHAAKGSRKAALAISLTATGALSGLFAFMDSSATASAGKVSTVGTTTASRVLTASTPSTVAPAADTTAAAAGAPAAKAVTGSSTATAASGTAAATATATTATTAKAAATTVAAKSASGLANGTYTGDSIPTRWGPVQVAVTIAAGKITEVKAIDVPMDRGKSVQINTRATPILRTEALTAQSSSIANVSGATYTSNGYADSLQSAIDQARSAVAANAA